MKKSKGKSSRSSEDGTACSSSVSSGSGGNRARFFPRLSLQRLLYGTPLMPGTRRPSGGQRSYRRSQSSRETATKSTSTAEVQSAGVEISTATDVSPTSSAVPLPPSPLPSPASSPSSSSELHPAPPVLDEAKLREPHECPLCLAELPLQCFPRLSTCEHRSCYDCLQQYLRVEISESRTSIQCPECSERLHPNDVRMILNDKSVYAKYEDFMVRRVLAVDPDTRWCPQPDCGYAVIASGCASCPKLRCLRPGCPGVFCYHCKADWHPNQTCDAAREQRRSLPLLLSLDAANAAASGNNAPSTPSINPLCRDSDIKPCPRCSVLIVKMDDGSCNHMTCAVCGAEFCWLCMKEISDLHYLSPSGCTFWGKKPWSRKKKILWQLGTLVGAPVGIGLVAGIALPAMMIGIPVWVGRKLYGRYKHSNKHKRNLVIASGVTASILVSPVVAGLVVSIGVPILLFYIYGVVPVSLCRSGGCDVSTSGSGFHFDFDDYSDAEEEEGEEEGGEGAEGGRGGRRLVTTELGARLGYRGGNIADAIPLDSGSHKGTNPSIGEASLSMDSGSHLERDEEDEDEEVTKLQPGKHAEHRKRSCMEVQAEVQPATSHHRLSLCSEETIGSEKSGNTADDGAASTRALAGSVLSYKVTVDSVSRDASAEVHTSEHQGTSKDHDLSKHVRKSQEDGGEILERVRFQDNVSVYNDTSSEQSPSSSSSLKLTSGRRSPSSGSQRSSVSMGRAIRHLLLQTRGSAEKLGDCESQT